ncbi:Glycerophosphocholine phosphodiesterase gpcpd1 [Tyrophagus putrescentiae]|nr:Glycerophosphocholine phosphodiesterase gpcpd1 [Tyrophagus putrescentiae]
MQSSFSLLAVTAAAAVVLFTSPATAVTEKNSDILLHGKTAILLKFFHSPLHFFGGNNKTNNETTTITYTVEAQSVGNSTTTSTWTTAGVLVSHLTADGWPFQAQPSTGVAYHPEEMVTFWYNSSSSSPLTTAFRLTVVHQEKGAHVLHQQMSRAVLAPFAATETAGYRNVTLLDGHFNAIGEVRVTYLVVRPITRFNPAAEDHAYSDFDHVVYMGHRGTGVGKRFDLHQEFIENTIAAFNYACSKGGDAIELDVQLSQDEVPIIYHDFFAKVFLHDRLNAHHNVSFHVPIKDIPFRDFKRISTNFMPHVRADIETEDNQSFETLENVLKKVKPGCGINVEIKYPQLKVNQLFEGAIGAELNDYTDRILEVLYGHAGSRPIVITTFHADLAVMVQLKQNRFRVAFLTSGGTTPVLLRPAGDHRGAGHGLRSVIHMKGLSLETRDVLTTPAHISYVRSRQLALYLWGGELNSYQRLVELKKAGVTALIFDKLDLILANHTVTAVNEVVVDEVDK